MLLKNPNERKIKEGINLAVDKVIDYLEKIAIKVDDNMLDQNCNYFYKQ